MDHPQRVAALSRAPIFHGLPERILARIAEVAEERTVAAGETFIVTGAVEPWMYLLLDGRAEVRRDGQPIATITPGATVGELAVLDPAPRSADVTADESCLLLRIEHAHLAELMAEEPELTEGIISMLVRLVRSSSERIGSESVSTV